MVTGRRGTRGALSATNLAAKWSAQAKQNEARCQYFQAVDEEEEGPAPCTLADPEEWLLEKMDRRATLGRVRCIRVFMACQGDNFIKISQAPPAAIICINS